MSDFRSIPYFRNYGISKDGKVINLETKRVLLIRKTKAGDIQVGMRGNNGKRANRCVIKLLREVWGIDGKQFFN